MAPKLDEGQTFSAKYSLLHRLFEDEQVDCWLAVDVELNERIFLKVFKQPLTGDQRSAIAQNIEKQRGLLHPQIARTYGLDQFETSDFIASEYFRSDHFDNNLSFETGWPILSQVAAALEFAHSLGFAHGHLHPNNILLDADKNVHLTDFGIGSSGSEQQAVYLSPQVKAGHAADISDDIFSFGQIVHKSLTGKHWHQGQTFEANSPVPDDLQQLLTSMLQESPYDRPKDLLTIIDVLNAYAAGVDNKIEVTATDFNRVQPESPVAAPGISHKLPRERSTISTRVAMTGFFVLVVVALIVFVFLPETEPTVSLNNAPVSSTTLANKPQYGEKEAAPAVAPIELARLKQLKEKGIEIAKTALRRQLEVEDIGGQIWAAKRYDEGVVLGLTADESYLNEEFQVAVDQYQEGISILDTILSSADEVFEENEQQGRQALEAGNAEVALISFTIMNAIKPGDPDIQRSIGRAENLNQVISLIRDGEVIEQNGELETALMNFSEAFTLDNQWPAAGEAVSRVKLKIANRAFNDQMSTAFAALAEKKYDYARQAFTDAQAILPASIEPQDGLQQIEISEMQDKINNHHAASTVFIEDEDWQQAASEYDAILALSPGTTFAVEGLNVVQKRSELENELLRYVAQPSILMADEALQAARSTLLDAARTNDPGPKLLDQINRLSQLVSLARIPIEIELRSDNKTEVTIYRVRNFGRLSSTKLTLIPGSYTVVGKRRGYRDVREEFVLKGGHPGPTILISCEEKI